MQNTAEKIEDFSSRGLNYFKRHMYKEAVEFWDSSLQENALDCNQIQEIKEAKNWFLNLQIDKKKKERIINQLNTLLEHNHVEFIGSFRNKDEKKLTPVADILVNEEGNILVIDEFNHRVQIYDREGKVISSFGKKGKELGQFYYPKALAQDSKGNLYVADCWNHRIQKFSPELRFLTTFGYYGNKEGEFNEPYDIAIDKNDKLFIVDRCNHRIQVFDSDGKFLYSFGHRGTILEEELAEFYKTPKELFSIPAFEFPTKIALDSKENLYVVDSGNCRIQKLNLSGEFLFSFGEKGEEKDKFQNPFDIAIDKNDQIFISDTISNRIYQFTPQGLFVLSLKGDDEDNPAHVHLFHSPSAITFDKEERLVVAEDLSTEIRILNSSHKPTEDIYRGKLLLVPEDSFTQSALADFHSENKQWNEAAEEYAKTLGCDKENLDIKLKLARCLSKAEFSESYIEYLDLIIDFSNQDTESLEKEILELYEEKYQIEKELLPKQWKHEWEILVNNRDDSEIELDLESKNRKINRAIRERLIKYNKLNLKKKEYISLLFQLCQQENFTKKKGTLNKNTVVFLKKALNSLLGELDQKSHFSFYLFFDIKKDLIRHVYEFIRSPDFRVDKKDLAEYLVNIYLSLNKNLLAFLREREEIYSKVEKELNFYEDSKVNYNSFIHLKRLHHKLNGFTYSISFRRARILEIISIFKNKILKEFIIFTKKSLQSFLSTIEEINWLVWEDPKFFINGTENYIIDDYDRLVFSIQDRLIEKKKNIKRDYLDKAVDILDKILVFSQSDNFSLSSFMNYIEKEIEALNIISENYEGRHNDYIEKNAQLEHQIRNKKNLSQDQMVSLRNILVVTRLNKQLTGLYLWQSEKIKIFLWKKIIKIIENYQDSKNSIKELLELENWINNLWQRSFEKQDKYKNEILENLQKNSYNSPVLDLYKNDLERQNSLFEYCFRKTHQVFLTLRNQINKNILRKLIEKCEEIVEKRKFHGDLELIKKSFSLQKNTSLDETKITEEFLKIVKKNNNKYFIEYDMSFGKLGTAQGDFYYPSIIAKDKDGNLLISDQFNHRIQKFTIDGQFISSFGTYGTSDENLLYPIGLAVDKEGFIYVSNMVGHCIKKISSTGEFVLSFGKYGFEEGELFWPVYLAVDFDQNVYVSDRLSNRIQKFSSQGEFLTSFNKTNKDINTLFDPVGIFIEKNRDILVGEPLRGQVKKINPKGKCLSTMRRPGIREQDFNSPLCFTQDLNEDIYISDFMNHRIQKFTKDFEFIWAFGTYGNGEGEFNRPLGMEIIDRYLFVCDKFNHRIQRFKISE